MKRDLVNGSNVVREYPTTRSFVTSVFTNLLLAISTVDANLVTVKSEQMNKEKGSGARTSS